MSLVLIDNALPALLVAQALRSALKGGEGSGYFGHAGRPGERGGSDSAGSPGAAAGAAPTTRKPSATLSDRPITRTQAIAVAIQKLDGKRTTGNLLASDAGKHFFALGFKGPVIKKLYDLSQMYKAGGAERQKAIGAIMTALASDTDLGDALRAQIDTEDELAKAKAGVRPAKIGNLPTAKKQGGKGKGASEEEQRLAADRARAQRDHDQELAGQIAEEKRGQAKEAARWQGKVGETVYLGESAIVDATDQGDTVSSGEAVLTWPQVVTGYHVLAGLAVSYGDPHSAITLLRRDALPPRGSAQKGADAMIINLDDSDVNADWIKLVNPDATTRDRAIHEALAKKANAGAWPDVAETASDESVNSFKFQPCDHTPPRTQRL